MPSKPMTDDAEAQLAQEMIERLAPFCGLMGSAAFRKGATNPQAPRVIAQLRSADDETALKAYGLVMAALWGSHLPDNEWWRSPLGMLMARAAIRANLDGYLRPSEAARLLGVNTKTISGYRRRNLMANDGSNVRLVSVLDWMLRQEVKVAS